MIKISLNLSQCPISQNILIVLNNKSIVVLLIFSRFLFRAVLPGTEQTNGDVEYNERFWWRSADEMMSSFKQALYQGSPFPIVSLAEYFSLHQEGFSWGSRYREAGYYASIMLWYVCMYMLYTLDKNIF